jgi:hypothetical protein
MQGVESWTTLGWFPRMWRSPEGEVWTEGDRYSNGMHYDGRDHDGRDGVEAMTTFDGEPLVLQRSWFEPGFLNTFETTKFSGWPPALGDNLSGEPVGGELGVILASTTDLWFTRDGNEWTGERIHDVFGSYGDMIGAAVSDVSILIAFSPNGREPIELWLGEPSGQEELTP